MTKQFENHDRLIAYRRDMEIAEAQLLKSLLEANGVPTFLAHENMATFTPAVRTDLMIRYIDRVRADSALENVEPLKFNRADFGDPDEPACRQCGSMHVHSYVGAVPTLMPGVKIAADPRDQWMHCMQCDSYYREGRRRFTSVGIAFSWAATMGLLTLAIILFFRWLSW